MKSLDKFKALHKKRIRDGQRVGQRFVNLYIKNQWPELFHCSDEDKAYRIIEKWLIDHQYTQDLPKEYSWE